MSIFSGSFALTGDEAQRRHTTAVKTFLITTCFSPCAFLWSEILQNQLLVFRAEHRAHSHLPHYRACLPRRNLLGSVVASPTVGAESLFTFRSVLFGVLSLHLRVVVLGPRLSA